jgi:hypothetical protein
MGLSLSHERGKGVEARVSIQCPACFPGPGAERCHNHSLLLARVEERLPGLSVSLGAFETAKSGLGIAFAAEQTPLLSRRDRLCLPLQIILRPSTRQQGKSAIRTPATVRKRW